jgi:hypothetical protein
MFIDQAPKIVSKFDVIVADGPAGLSEVALARALLLVADLALLPCGPSFGLGVSVAFLVDASHSMSPADRSHSG